MDSSVSPVRRDLVSGLVGVLRPIIRILLRSGFGFAEFNSVAKTLYVEAATQEFGLRGRPTNTSRVATLVGLTRREVKRIKTIGDAVAWNPGMESSPINNVIHFWHFDQEFSISPGKPRPLSISEPDEFAMLVKRYARDVPVSVLKKELVTSGTAILNEEEQITLVKRYFQADQVSDDLLRNILFALRNHAGTACHNYSVSGSSATELMSAKAARRFERSAWTTCLRKDHVEEFGEWVQQFGQRFLEQADDWIGSHEVRDEYSPHETRTVGVGVYFFDTNTPKSDDSG